MRIAILVTTSPEKEDVYFAGKAALALLRTGHQVDLFLMDDGVFAAAHRGSPHRLPTDVEELLKNGATVAVCDFTTAGRGLGKDDLFEGVRLASQFELSRMVARADRFLVFS